MHRCSFQQPLWVVPVDHHRPKQLLCPIEDGAGMWGSHRVLITASLVVCQAKAKILKETIFKINQKHGQGTILSMKDGLALDM